MSFITLEISPIDNFVGNDVIQYNILLVIRLVISHCWLR